MVTSKSVAGGHEKLRYPWILKHSTLRTMYNKGENPVLKELILRRGWPTKDVDFWNWLWKRLLPLQAGGLYHKIHPHLRYWASLNSSLQLEEPRKPNPLLAPKRGEGTSGGAWRCTCVRCWMRTCPTSQVFQECSCDCNLQPSLD